MDIPTTTTQATLRDIVPVQELAFPPPDPYAPQQHNWLVLQGYLENVTSQLGTLQETVRENTIHNETLMRGVAEGMQEIKLKYAVKERDCAEHNRALQQLHQEIYGSSPEQAGLSIKGQAMYMREQYIRQEKQIQELDTSRLSMERAVVDAKFEREKLDAANRLALEKTEAAAKLDRERLVADAKLARELSVANAKMDRELLEIQHQVKFKELENKVAAMQKVHDTGKSYAFKLLILLGVAALWWFRDAFADMWQAVFPGRMPIPRLPPGH